MLSLNLHLFCGTMGCLLAMLPSQIPAFESKSAPATSPARSTSTGFSVNNYNRNEVIAFWHSVYQASEGYEKRVNWTGNYRGKNGTTSSEFIKDVERRINYFRAMVGVPPTVRVNTGSTVAIDRADLFKPSPSARKANVAQDAALMLIRNYDPNTGMAAAMTHNPPRGLSGWSKGTWNANAKGNLGFGVYGPGAMTQYMVEEITSSSSISSWNSLVGHRRWMIHPEATNFATGDNPGESAALPPTNVLYVTQRESERGSDPTPGFVAYPSPGYFPAPINSRFWSFSLAGADLSSATVRMTDAKGKSIGVSNVQRNASYGDPAIIWMVKPGAAVKTVSADKTFHVKISGVRGTKTPSEFNYSVTLVNPDRLTSNQRISGPKTAISNASTSYSFKSPDRAEALRITTFRKRAATWKEDASPIFRNTVIDNTSSRYPLRAKMKSYQGFGKLSGPKAFHLTFPTSYDLITRGVPEQSFEITRNILPKSNAKLKFLYRRGYMTTGSTLVVESSNNGGVTWTRLGKPITGVSNRTYDAAVSSASFPLKKSSQPLRIRFRYFVKGVNPIFVHDGSPTGIFIDKITTKNCDWLDPQKTKKLSAGAKKFKFNASSAGASLVEGRKWGLALQTKLGGRWFPYGPVKTIKIKAP